MAISWKRTRIGPAAARSGLDPANMGSGWVAFNAALCLLWLLVTCGGSLAQSPRPLRIVVLGDSLTAGLGLATSEAFPAQLGRALAERGHAVEMINAGVSGDTTGAGLERLDWAVPEGVDAVIVELGANDALRGLDPDAARRNLEAIVAKLRQRRLAVLVAGMRAPRNLGEPYAARFDGMFEAVAERHGALLYPFFLDGIALDPKLNQGDGIHPNAAGVAEIVRRMLPSVERLIARARAGE